MKKIIMTGNQGGRWWIALLVLVVIVLPLIWWNFFRIKPVYDVTTAMTREETKAYYRTLSDEDVQKHMSEEQFERWKKTGDWK